MDQLPHKILTIIVGHLSSSSRDIYSFGLINKTCYRIANPLIWRHLPGECDNNTLTCLKLNKQPTAIGKIIQSLELVLTSWTDDDFLFVLNLTHHLQKLELMLPLAITDNSLQHLPPSCPQLQSLTLYDVPVGQTTMQALAEHCPQLTRLRLEHCHKLGPDALSVLVGACPLEHLTISHPASSDIQTPLTHFDSLTHLSLDFSDDDSYGVNRVLSQGAKATCWTHLTYLSITAYQHKYGPPSSPLTDLLASHPQLEALALVDGKFDDSLLDDLSTIEHPGIKSLNLWNNKNITANGLRRLVQAWRLLGEVSLLQCNMTSTMFPEAGQDCLVGAGMNQLKCLDQQTIRSIRLLDAAV